MSENTRIKAGDLTQEHVGKFVSCHDPDSGYVYRGEDRSDRASRGWGFSRASPSGWNTRRCPRAD